MKFKPLTTKEGLSNNSVNDIISDNTGRLWIATWDGLNVYNGTNVVVYKHQQNIPNSLAGNVVLGLLKDKDQQIWVLTDNQTVSVYQGDGVFKAYTFKEQPNALLNTRNGNVAVSCNSGYLAFKNGAFTPTSQDNIKTNNNLGVLKHFLLQKYPNLTINDIFKDTEGNIWYATRRNGLYIIPNTPQNINNQFIEHYTYDLYSPYSFTSNEIEKIYQDDFGNIWLAHKDGGVSMAYNGAEQITTIIPHPVKFPHLPNETIRAITKDNHSTIWLGYYTNGLFYYSEKTHCFLPYVIKEAKTNADYNRIRSLYTDSYGTVWAGTYGGLIKITEHGYTLFNANTINNFPYNRNYAFYEDDSTNLWVACWGGLGKLHLPTNTFKAFNHQEQLSPYHIRHVIKQKDTLVLATEENGILFFTEAQGIVKKVTVKNGILGNSTYRVYYDAGTGYYWIATLGGVSVYDVQKGVIKNITEADGLPSHMVYGLLSNEHKMWISTTKGIATIDKENYHVFQLPKDQGWQAEEFSEGASYQDMKGMLFFGGINGFSYFQPDAYHYSLKPPKLHVTIDGKETFKNSLNKGYNNNNLSVNITVVSFSGVHPAVYYKLDGADTDWKLYNGQELLYNNLRPGHYRLLTKIEGGDAIVKNHLKLHIAKPFYNTTWFYLVCLVSLIIVVGIFIVRKNAAAKRIQRMLEAKITERTKIIEAQKNELLHANKELEAKHNEVNTQKEQVLALHHQLKNRDFEVDKFKTFVLSGFKPKLTKMMNNAEIIQDEDTKKSLEKELLDMIQTLSEWDYLDQVSSLGAVAASQIQFKKLMQRIYEQVQPEKIACEAFFKFEVTTNSDVISVDVLRLKLLFQYLLNEVLKYSNATSKLQLTATLQNTAIAIVIQSNSTLLAEQWDNITKYSPYYKAFVTLLTDLNGHVTTANTATLELTINIPVANAQQVADNTGVLLLKHLENTEQKHKPSILIYCDTDEITLVNGLLKDTPYQLIFEHNAKALTSALQQIHIKALVVYNALFTPELIQVLNLPAFKQLPGLYIAEHIDLEMEEKVMDNGINAIIYLPVNNAFIQKKLQVLINQQQKYTTSSTAILDTTLDNNLLNPHEKIVKQALEHIRVALGNPEFNVDKLITEMEISRSKCYRVFKEVLQQSPSDVIINLRLQKAEQLLLTGNLNISEISFECGFNDPKYFSRMFKKHFGSSPKTYKQNQQEATEV